MIGGIPIPVPSIVLNPDIWEIETLFIVCIDVIVQRGHRVCIGSERDASKDADRHHQNHC